MLARIAELLGRAKTIYTCGNGGSAANAMHAVVDLAKNCSRPGFKKLNVVGLCETVPYLTAVGNDIDWKSVFSYQLDGRIVPGDVLMAFSCSGRSLNVIEAVRSAKAVGAWVVAFSGFDGGNPLDSMGDFCVHLNSESYGAVEDFHMSAVHSIVELLKEREGLV